ncbi:MAG: Rieske (2Fe-2S) protein [Chitinophagaceae bacterium]
MNRKKFISTGCISCMGGGLMLSLLETCSSTKITNGKIAGSDMLVTIADFEITKGGKRKYKKYLVVENQILQHPICVFRFDEKNYEALLMKCPHQGAELQVFGDKLQCPAHGSEFNNRGKVENGPANAPLRTFPIIIENNELKISLK